MEHSEPLDNFDGLLEHAGWMQRLARELVHDASTADDLVQDTWLAFLRARPDTDRPVEPWLASVVRNAAALRRRKASSRGAREADVARPESVPSADELVERAEVQQELARAVLALDDPYRTVLLLRYYEGLTPKQIAAARGVPDATVRSQLHRGLGKLRERLDDHHGGERRAWIALLTPIAGRPEAVAGVGVSALGLFAIACVAVLLALGGYWGFERARTPALERSPSAVATVHPDQHGTATEPRNERRAVDAVPGALERSWTVVDERTGAPLADYALRAEGVTLRADSQGVVRLPAALTQVSPVDDARQRRLERNGHARFVERAVERKPIALEPGATRAELRVPSGPTVDLRFTTTSLDVSRLSASLSTDAGVRAPGQLAPVRPATDPGRDAWVRFAALPERSADQRGDYHLAVFDDAGYRRGTARIGSDELSARTVVDVDFARTGVLAGSSSGLGPDERAALTMTVQPIDRPGATVRLVQLDEDDRFTVRWLEPGLHRVQVSVPGRPAWTTDVVVRADRVQQLDVDLDAVPTLGPITGEVESDSGTYNGQLLVFLRGTDGIVHDVFPTTWREAEDGTLRAPFRFEPSPAGELHLDVVSLADAVRFEVDPPTFRAPQEAVRVRALDASPSADWRFDVRDADSGEPLEAFVVEARVEGAEARRFVAGGPVTERGSRSWTLHVGGMRWNRFESAAPLRRLATSARFTWTVEAEGYVTTAGSEQAFEVLDTTQRVARVHLHRE